MKPQLPINQNFSKLDVYYLWVPMSVFLIAEVPMGVSFGVFEGQDRN